MAQGFARLCIYYFHTYTYDCLVTTRAALCLTIYMLYSYAAMMNGGIQPTLK